MKFRGRLFLAMGPLLVALAVVGVSGAYVARSLARQPSHMLSANYQSITATSRMNEHLARLDRVMLLAQAGAEPPAADIRAQMKGFGETLALAERNITEPGEGEAVARLRAAWNQYQGALVELLAAEPAARSALFHERLYSLYRAVHGGVDAVLLINQDAMNRKGEAALRRGERFEHWLLPSVFVVSLLGVLATLSLTRRLLRPLSVVSETVRRFGSGDVNARARIAGTDEVGMLAHEFNALADHLERYRKSSLGELLQAQRASQAAIDGLPDPVVVLQASGEPQGCNQAAASHLCIDTDRGVDPSLRAVDAGVRATLSRMHAHVAAGRGAYHPKGFEEAVRVKTPVGERVYLPHAAAIRGESGEMAGTVAVFQDITRVFHFDELKSNLVSTVAHEFRTPLTSLRMAIHLCLEQAVGPLTEKQADLLTAGREDCERLQRMVDDLLDLSRLESGRLELQRRKVLPEELLDMAVDAHHAAAEAAGLSLRRECLPGLPELFVDADRLHLVFANLVTNAIRYSPAGGEILVRARTGASPGDPVRFEVLDQGPGIPAGQEGAVFEKFFRVPGSPAGGAGLGLFIARGIVVSHGGEIGAANRGGHGAIFWFTLPVDLPAGA